MDMKTGPYVFRHGDVWWSFNGDERHVCDGTGELAVAYDATDGTLHKHGSADSVQRWAEQTREKFWKGGFEGYANEIVVVSFPATAETVQELNACVETTSRVMKIVERLQQIGESNPEIASRPRYPQ